jgi:subtilisin family serine protease
MASGQLRTTVPESSKLARFVLLPARGMRSTALLQSALAQSIAPSIQAEMTILDSIHEDGAKLVEMTTAAVAKFVPNHPGLRLVPLVYYQTAVERYRVRYSAAAAAISPGPAVSIRIASRSDGSPVSDAKVVAFTNFASRQGAEDNTDANGNVILNLGGVATLERVYVYPKANFWSLRKDAVATGRTVQLDVLPVDPSYRDELQSFYGTSPLNAGTGVTVGVVDTGVGPHPDITVIGGENTVVGENPTDFGDNGKGHGTHVAGIIAGAGAPPNGMRGLAPGVRLFSYRVFGAGGGDADNYSIAKAIDRAVADGCDLINLSLGAQGQTDPAVSQALADAVQKGCLPIIAAGNDDRKPVSAPGNDPSAVAISALGRKNTFPGDSAESDYVAPPFGKDKNNFVASFSNIGSQIAFIGCGVGVVSTVLGGYVPMSGTSMACPAVTGRTAALLAGQLGILGAARDNARCASIRQMIVTELLGFGANFEGQGFIK